MFSRAEQHQHVGHRSRREGRRATAEEADNSVKQKAGLDRAILIPDPARVSHSWPVKRNDIVAAQSRTQRVHKQPEDHDLGLIRREFAPQVNRFYRKPVLWIRPYCPTSCGGAPLSIIKQNLEQQAAPV